MTEGGRGGPRPPQGSESSSRAFGPASHRHASCRPRLGGPRLSIHRRVRPSSNPGRLWRAPQTHLPSSFLWPQRRPDGIAAIIRKVGWAARDVDIVNVGPDGDKSAHDLSSDLLWESLFTDLRKGSYDAVSWALLARRPRRQGTSLRARHRFGHQIFRTGFRIAALSASVRAGSLGHLFCFTVCQTPSRGVHPRRRLRHWTPDPRPGIVSIFTLPEFLALSDSEG